MYNILIACDTIYYNQWAVNCIKSLKKFVPWANIHVVVVNPFGHIEKLDGVKYYEDFVEFPNEGCKVPYFQAVRFIKCAEIFKKEELVMTIDCDTLCTRSFTEKEFKKILSDIHVQRHQKNVRWMAGLVTYGKDSDFRNRLREELLKLPLENWFYGWDQEVLNSLGTHYNYNRLDVGDWMSFGRGRGVFLTLKGDQKTAEGYLNIYNEVLKTIN